MSFVANFSHLLPEKIFEAAELLGGRATGRFLALNAMENRVYDVEMEDNSHVIAKFYRPGRWSRASIEAEHEYLRLAVEAEIPVVAPLKDGQGQTLFEKEGILFTLFPKKPGRLEPELNPEQLTRLGRYLARLHQVGAQIGKVPRISLTPKTYGLDSLQYLREEALLAPGLAGRYDYLVKSIVEKVTPLFTSRFPMVLVHGDCHAGNILWNGDEPFFIDFDDMLFAPALQDCWMLIGGDDEYALKNQEILLQAYEEIRPFDRTSLILMEPLRALRIIYFSAWIARRREDGAFKLAFPHFGTEKYWQEQIEILSHQFERIERQVEHRREFNH